MGYIKQWLGGVGGWSRILAFSTWTCFVACCYLRKLVDRWMDGWMASLSLAMSSIGTVVPRGVWLYTRQLQHPWSAQSMWTGHAAVPVRAQSSKGRNSSVGVGVRGWTRRIRGQAGRGIEAHRSKYSGC